MNSKVSVVIPCYNCEKYIGRCFEHLINQTYKNLEIILVNDESNDNSESIILEYKNKFEAENIEFKYIKQKNQGLGGAINTGIKYITGDYFMWQDPDDYYEYDAVESMLKHIVNGNYDLIRGRSVHRDGENLNIILKETFSKYPNETNIFNFYFYSTDDYQYGGIFMFKTSYFDKVVLNREIYPSRAGQNWQLILPMAYKGVCGYLDKVVHNYIVYSNSMSHSIEGFQKEYKSYKDHEQILINVIKYNIEMNIIVKFRLQIFIKLRYLKRKIKLYIKHLLGRI